jgi:hypothetical protein
MPNERFKSGYGYLLKLTVQNYPIWNQRFCRVLIAWSAYTIVTSVEPLPLGNGVTIRALPEDWHGKANEVIALIRIGCCDELLRLTSDIDDPVVMWDALMDRLANTSTVLGHTQVLQ